MNNISQPDVEERIWRPLLRSGCCRWFIRSEAAGIEQGRHHLAVETTRFFQTLLLLLEIFIPFTADQGLLLLYLYSIHRAICRSSDRPVERPSPPFRAEIRPGSPGQVDLVARKDTPN